MARRRRRRSSLLVVASLLACLLATIPLSRSQEYENETDRVALLSFKSMISDDPLDDGLSSWNASVPSCQWQGVACELRGGQWRVVDLNLSSFNLAGTISPSLSNLTFLEGIHLSDNHLRGPIPQQLGLLPHLQQLNLSANLLTGTIPPSLGRLSNLTVLSLSRNQLAGTIPPSLGNLSALVSLVLGGNQLVGEIPASIGNLSTLRALVLAENNLTGAIPPSFGELRALARLVLWSNSLTGVIPPSVWNLSSLETVDLSINELSGTLPLDIGNGLPRLRQLILGLNQFHGPIPLSFANASSLEWLELLHNKFSGTVPDNLGSLQNLSSLVLGYNRLVAGDWNFMTSLTNCSNLQMLILENNALTGTLPDSIANLSATLQGLSLGDNQISGPLPAGIGNLVNLAVVAFGRNRFQGRLPETIGLMRGLHLLDLDKNQFSGQIPETLGDLINLNQLFLGDNAFEGSIPISLSNCTSLQRLHLDNNKLSGTIPKGILAISSISISFGLSHNSLVGPLPSEVGELRNLQSFDVSYNNLSGEIPSSLGKCQLLEYLYLEGNMFSGPIPSVLRDLRGLKELNLGHNLLSGSIPQYLANLNLSYLNLSFNNLDGQVPEGGVFANATAFSVIGNRELCGGASELNLQACSTHASGQGHRSGKLIVIVSVVVAVCVVLLLGFSLVYWMRRPRTSLLPPASADMKDQHMNISYLELLRATDGFSAANLIGSGSFGSVYRGILGHADAKVVAVKVLNLQQRGASKSFIAECETLRNVKHRNLVKIITACSSIDFQRNDFKALVFEFMQNGSLENWLHPEVDEQTTARKLTLIQLLDIAIDVASAIEYLHHHGATPIIHCDIKPSNILLDVGMTAHVGDFGLAKFLIASQSESIPNTTRTIELRGSIGYVAPEYGMGNDVSTQGDVYSYGILLLEMFTGRRPTDEAFKDGLNLRKFAEMVYSDPIIDIVVPSYLLFEEEAGGRIQNINIAKGKRDRCMHSLIGIGLKCSNESPMERMQIGDVTRELYAIRDEFLSKVIHVK